MVDILRRTHCYQTSGTISLSAGTSDYTLSSSILALLKVYTTSNGSMYQLQRVSVDELVDLRVGASSAQSSPVFRYALAGASTLMMYPTPASADTVNTIHVPLPTAMSSSSHDPSNITYGGIPVQWHYGIELYALWKMADSIDDQSSSQGERYRTLYEGDNGRGGYIAQIRAELARMGGRGKRARLGSGRRNIPHTNDQYPGW